MNTPADTATRNRYCYLVSVAICLYTVANHVQAQATTQQIPKGFSATPDSSVSSFQPLLTDPTNQFSLGFQRVDRSQLSLVILHTPSSLPVWAATTSSGVQWSKHTQLVFNGSFILLEKEKKVWSAQTETSYSGDQLVLLNNSNLQIIEDTSVVWQSFDSPSDTLVENQNFTSEMALTNGLFSMRLGDGYIGLYYSKHQEDEMYFKRTAMQAKAPIVEGNGPVYVQISSNGYLGMYQAGQTAPVDVLPFDTFQRPISGFRRLKLETDGNLKAYYWNTNDSSWITDMVAVTDECELPGWCGSYGLCPGGGKPCECLDDAVHDGSCLKSSLSLSPSAEVDFCAEEDNNSSSSYWVLRRKGVEFPHKQLMGFQTMGSFQQCEASCENNCTCWGATFNNASGYCYQIHHPIDTLVGVRGDTKMGYFKVVRDVEKKSKYHVPGIVVGVVGLFVLCVVILVSVFRVHQYWRRNKRGKALMEDGMSPGPYTDLGASSFRSIELCKT